MPKFTSPEEKFQWITTAPIPGLVGRLAVPTIISMLITSIYNMADTYFVGNLGKSAQGAVSVIMPLMAIIQAIGFTFGNGSGNTVSRLLGQKKLKEAEEVAATGFFCSVFAGLVLLLFGELFLTQLVELLGATETILPYAKDYAKFILIGAPYMIATLVLNNQFRFAGSATYAMMGVATGGILNMILDPIFIFKFNMGVGGAAVATILSQLVSFCILMFNCGRKGTIAIRWKNFKPVEHIKVVLRNGMPAFWRQGLASIASVLLNWAAKPYGDAAIAAMGIVNKVAMFSNSAVLGFGQGFQPVCGFNFGAKKYDRVRQAYWFCVKVGIGVLLVVGGTIFALAPQVVYLFQRADAEVVELGAMALRCSMAVIPVLAYTTVNNMMLQTVGESTRASILSSARQGLFFIPAILILPRCIDFTGVMIAQPVSDVCACLLAIPLSTSFLRKMRVMEEQEKREKDLQKDG